MAREAGIETVELLVAEATVGQLRFRPRGEPPPAALLRLVANLIGLELERAKAPERASEEAVGDFLGDLLTRRITDRENIAARSAELGCDLSDGAIALVVRARPQHPEEGDWRARVLTLAERGARAVERGSLAALVAAGLGRHARLRARARDPRPGQRGPPRGGRRPPGARGQPRRLPADRRAFAPHERSGRPPPRRRRGAARRQRRRSSRPGGALVRGDRRLPPAAARDERGPGRAARLLRRDGRAARGLRRAVRDRPGAHARVVPGRGRQRREDRRAPLHPPPHGPLPARARARADLARRVLDRRPRAPVARPQGDARARHRCAGRPHAGEGDRGRARASGAQGPLRRGVRSQSRTSCSIARPDPYWGEGLEPPFPGPKPGVLPAGRPPKFGPERSRCAAAPVATLTSPWPSPSRS